MARRLAGRHVDGIVVKHQSVLDRILSAIFNYQRGLWCCGLAGCTVDLDLHERHGAVLRCGVQSSVDRDIRFQSCEGESQQRFDSSSLTVQWDSFLCFEGCRIGATVAVGNPERREGFSVLRFEGNTNQPRLIAYSFCGLY